MKQAKQPTGKDNKIIFNICIILIFIISIGILDCTNVKASTSIIAKPTASTVLVNGNKVIFEAYNINGSNYLKLRDLAFILSRTDKQFDIGYDIENKAILLTSGKLYTVTGGEMVIRSIENKTAIPTSSKIYLDSKEILFDGYNINGNNYFKLRDIGKTLNFGVDYDGATSTIVIDTSKPYVVPEETTAISTSTQSDSNKIFTEDESAYLKIFLDIIKQADTINNLFNQTVQTNDLETLIMVSVELSNAFEPHYHISCPSQRFKQIYEYMKNAADAAQIVPYFLNLAYQQGDPEGLTNANKMRHEIIVNINSAMSEIEKYRPQEEGQNANSKSPETSIKTYDDFPEVPDFGAFASTTLYKIRSNSNAIAYLYRQDFEVEKLNEYINILKARGFLLSTGFVNENNGKPVVIYKKDNLNVGISVITEFSPDLDNSTDYLSVMLLSGQ